MKNSFSVLKENILTRNFGGTTICVADPYITGYHFIHFETLPEKLKDYTQKGNSGIASKDDIQKVLAATCTGVTTPGGTLNVIEFAGLGGIKWGVPGNVDYGTTVSLKFTEFSGTPLLDIIHGWVKMIRDYRTGTSSLEETDFDTNGYSNKTYSGLMYYWTTAPDAKTVEYYACYDGMFPTKDPQDLFGSDIETIGRMDLDIEFHVDYVWHEDWVLSKCQTLAATVAGTKTKIYTYGSTPATGSSS